MHCPVLHVRDAQVTEQNHIACITDANRTVPSDFNPFALAPLPCRNEPLQRVSHLYLVLDRTKSQLVVLHPDMHIVAWIHSQLRRWDSVLEPT